jgi:SAM-dependent methyltransferase
MTEQSRHHHDRATADHPAAPGEGPGERPGDGPADWDERYAESGQVWSGRPNGALVTETEDLSPGRALDVGCGEGADAVWLALRGWEVTGLDVSRVALGRAEAAAADAGVSVRWLAAGLLEAELEPGGFDLVSVQYPALRRTTHHDAERALLAAVAPGGTLLVVLHADVDAEQSREHGFDPGDYVGRDEVVAVLDDSWRVETDERRPRTVDGGSGAQHTHDLVLTARRLR